MSTKNRPRTRLQSPHELTLLKALYFQGQSNDCGPYTTATALKALRGINLDPAELAARMSRPVWRGPLFVVRRVPNWATFPWGIVDVLREYGVKAHWRLFSSPEQLWQGLEQGRVLMPVIGSWRPVWAHVMSLVPWDPQLGWGFANTQYAHHHIHWLDDDTLQRRWRAMARILVWAEP